MVKTVVGKNGNILTPWQPGQSGNPKGLPKGYKKFVTHLKEACNKTLVYKDIKNNTKKMKGGEALAVMLLAKALDQRDLHAAQIIIQNIDSDLEEFAPLIVQNNLTINTSNLNKEQLIALKAATNAATYNADHG